MQRYDCLHQLRDVRRSARGGLLQQLGRQTRPRVVQHLEPARHAPQVEARGHDDRDVREGRQAEEVQRDHGRVDYLWRPQMYVIRHEARIVQQQRDEDGIPKRFTGHALPDVHF